MNRFLRWLVPAVVGAAVVAASAGTTAFAGRSPDVPDADVAQVLAALAASDVEAFSGTVVSRSDLGLPELPAAAGGQAAVEGEDPAGRASDADPQALAMRLLGGDSTVRVWVDGHARQRAQILDPFSQIDIVHNGSEIWTYVSNEDAATHLVLAEPGTRAPARSTAEGLPSPGALAEQLLAAADPTTAISLGAPQSVAGRDAWTVLITPRTTGTLVAQASVAVDTRTGMALRTSVIARGQEDPAVDVGFTTLDLSRPDAERFTFTPPGTATVTEKRMPAKAPDDTPPAATGSAPTVLGQGWTSIVQWSGGWSGADLASAGPALAALTTRVEGGRAVRTALVTVLITDDGRVLAGAVPLPTLQAAAE